MNNNYNIGIYGISGSGKSTLIRNLCKETPNFKSFEGSTIIANILNNDVSNFKLLNNKEKYIIREEVISIIKKQSIVDRHNIIDGHYSFIKEYDNFEIVITKACLEFFTHIFYLDINDKIIKKQQVNDKSKKRNFSIKQIKKWKEFEKNELQKLCKNNNIDFNILTTNNINSNIDSILEIINKENLLNDLKKYVDSDNSNKYLLFDADNTIVDFDTGKDYMYQNLNIDIKNVKLCFNKDGYCFSSFLKLSKLYSQIDNDSYINAMKNVASKIEIEDDFLNLMQGYNNKYNICIVTAGFSILWQEVLKKYNLEKIKVFGGNNLNIDDYIIDNNLKGLIVTYLQSNNKYVVSFGDSLLDKEMLIKSNKGYFVIRNKIRNDVINELCRHNHIKYLSINSLNINDLEETNFNKIREELN
jgi:adenylate kinase/phosphoserine phosphatase